MRNSWGMAAMLVAALPAMSLAATLKVPQQFETIQAAVDAAAAGDTIKVSRGIYNERVTLNGKDNVRLLGKKAIWDGAIDGSKGTCLDATGNGITVQGFLFWNGNVRITGDDATVAKCSILSADDDGVEIVGARATITKSTMRGCYYGADVDGDGATITKNRVSNMDDGGIEVDGNDCEVSRNTIATLEDGVGIDLSGNGCTISRNSIYNTDEENIDASGQNLLIEKNRCTANGDYGMDVSGDGFRIVGNRVSGALDDSDGMSVSTSTQQGGGLIEKNVIEDCVEDGLYVSGNNVTLRGNKVMNCGSEDDEAIEVNGNDVLVEACQVIDCEGDGFDVSGDRIRLVKCKVTNALEDGFDISGDSNELIDCSATGCLAEGIDNEGTNTVLRGGKFTGNRIDIANDTGGGASFATFDPKKFDTGGEDTAPELD